jgi:methyl-accepting chemotaxis protein
MKWFNNLKVGVKVFLSSAIFLILIGIISLMGVLSLRSAQGGFGSFYDNRFMPVTQLNGILSNLLHIRVNMGTEQIAAEEGQWDAVNKAIEDSKKYGAAYQEYWKQYKATDMSAEEKKMVKEWEKIVVPVREVRNNFQKTLEARNFKLSKQYLDQWMEGFVPIEEMTVKMIKHEEQVGKEMMAEQERAYASQLVINLALLAIAIGMGIIATLLLSRAVSRPVARGLEFAKRLEEGDLTGRIDLKQNDELGLLARSLNRAADSIEGLISNVIVAAQNLAQAVGQISSGNQNLSQRTSEQASSLEEIASTIEEATATINQNAENAAQARDLTNTGATKSIEGNRIAVEAVTSIIEMNNSSKKVADIIAVINEIAFQTNLLALNAAVEAARAGEQGRGFAVVAGEVRNLAQRSGNAAREIETLIKDTVAKVENSTDLVSKTGNALTEIAEAAKTSAQIITEIAAASLEQKQGINQINNAIAEMDNMTQQNASLVEETASASEEMSNQAEDLLEMVKKFKISDTLTEDASSRKHREVHLRAAESAPARKVSEGGNGNGKKRVKAAEEVGAFGKTADASQMKQIMKQEGFEEF